MIMNIWTKWVIDFGYGKGQIDKVIGPRPTNYKAYQMNRIYFDEYNKVFFNKYNKIK